MAVKESVTADKDDIAGHDGDVDSAMKLGLEFTAQFITISGNRCILG